MINIDDKTRRLSQATIVIGYKQENKDESIEFEIPDYLKEYGKKICFKTKDGKVFSKLFDNTTSNIFTFTRTETQYGELNATIEFFKTENEDMIIYKTSMLHIIFNESIICEDEVQPDEPKIPILESLIEKVTDLNNTITEGDTFIRQDGKWYEKHCWKKMLLNGTEKVGVSGDSTNEILAIVYDINNAVDGFGYSNYFLYSSQVELNKMSVYNGGKNLRVNVSKMQFADSESFKAKLKELYEAGTPVIIYYKLAEPILLECTEAQSKVLDEIYSKAHHTKT